MKVNDNPISSAFQRLSMSLVPTLKLYVILKITDFRQELITLWDGPKAEYLERRRFLSFGEIEKRNQFNF